MKVNGETVLGHRGYAILKEGNEDLVEKLKELLTVTPKVFQGMVASQTEASSFPVYRENSKKLYLPKNFGLQKFGLPTTTDIPEGLPAPRLIFQGTIRKEQEEPVRHFLEATNDSKRMGGIISLACAAGKTVMSLYIASQFQKKTLVICHKEFLLNQWKERIEQFLPQAKVGMIKQKKVDVEDKDIVLGSLQSLAMREYPESIFRQFGFVVIDECHHIAAEIFSQCLPKITARRMLGLSATLKRKDGLSKVIEWFLGKPVFQKKRDDNHLMVLVKRFYDPHPDYGREIKLWNGNLNVAKMINRVCEYQPRNYMIVRALVDVLKEEPDRKVLILSERRNHLALLEEILIHHGITSIGYYIGGMKQEELDKSAQKQVLLGTFQLAQEGMDVPSLNTLILASPVSSIEQAVGRIQREKQEARRYKPIVIDIIDEFSLFERQGMKRLSFYRQTGYEIDDPTRCSSSLPEEKADKPNPKYRFVEDPDEQ